MTSHYLVAALATALTLYADGSSIAAATPERPKVSLRASGGGATTPYTLLDGAPPPSAYPSPSRSVFNDTGQIFGIATSAAKEDRVGFASDFDCLVWTGARFVDISPAGTFESCAPFAIDGADPASKAFTVVGRFRDVYHELTPDYQSVGDPAQSPLRQTFHPRRARSPSHRITRTIRPDSSASIPAA